MDMLTDGGDNIPPADEAVARHRALLAVLDGQQPMDWAAWALPIYDAQNLTPRGREVVLWAADALRRAFGDTFLMEAFAAHRARLPVELWQHPEVHPVFGPGVWPLANYAPWAIANLLHFAAQLELLRAVSRPIRISMKDYRDPVKWIHGLLQLEVAGLGLRAGWRASFEPLLSTGRRADVRLDGVSASLLVETSSLRMSTRERKALTAANDLSGSMLFRLRDIAERHGVHISGDVVDLTPQMETTGWWDEVDKAAAATALDGDARDMPAPEPNAGAVRITREWSEGQSLSVSCPNPDAPPDPLARLAHKVREKAEQAAGSSEPVWVRLEEFAGIWLALDQRQLTLAEKLTGLTPLVRQLLAPYPELAGIILAPVAQWAGSVELERIQEVIIGSDTGAAAVRSSLPPHRVRETLIVARTSGKDIGVVTFLRWYEAEAGWLDWALAQCGQPSFAEVVQMGG